MRRIDQARPHVTALFRIVVGLLFACHGAATLFGLFGGGHGAPPSFAEWPSWWAAVIQLVGGLLVALGIGTRVAALICSGSMAYAYFTVHFPKNFLPIENGGESAAMFCWAFLIIAVTGPGKWALSSVFSRNQERVGVPVAA
ncbi:DoxX family protein [Labedaea rhizosphaerae]|uniref:Putative oxidoreductase n=1 Tax=Labedaea rhizosphaerae TaxID=598644 RepID=A0A4R6SNZ5_LABRH|nr:DoxX family protein [Labedaea rhizosphaerae]TDQ05152.1 putative oxidoreductase [Labedaea rhizosphaerae]